jgi:Glycosyl hydrolases family 16
VSAVRRSLVALLSVAVVLGVVSCGISVLGPSSIRVEPPTSGSVPPATPSPDPSEESSRSPSASASSPPPKAAPYRPNLPTKSTRGFKHLAGQDFDEDAPVGKVASRKSAANRPDQDWILPYANWSGHRGGQYRFQENVSVHDGMLDVHVRSIDGRNTGAAWIWLHPDPVFKNYGFTYGAVEQRVKVVGNIPGYGVANLLWPDSEDWGDGEIDFPEAGFDEEPKAYHHCLAPRPADNCSIFDTGVSWSQWHVYRIEWLPTGTSYYIDGRLIGTNTDSTPHTSHHWVTQIARDTAGHKDPALEGHYLVDWVRFEAPVEK